MKQRVLGIDVGNSAVKFARLIDDGGGANKDIGVATLAIEPDGRLPDVPWNDERFDATRYRIASVNRGVAAALTRSLVKVRPDAKIKSFVAADVPIEVDVPKPDHVGIDRLLAAWHAWQTTACDTVVIDVGSAVTVDWIDRVGAYRGGAIFPGFRLQTRSLAAGTDMLSEIDWNVPQTIAMPKKNTFDAIRLGILASIAGGCERLIQQYRDDFASPHAEVVLTGGDAARLIPHLRCDHRHIPAAVCRGLLAWPEPDADQP